MQLYHQAAFSKSMFAHTQMGFNLMAITYNALAAGQLLASLSECIDCLWVYALVSITQLQEKQEAVWKSELVIKVSKSLINLTACYNYKNQEPTFK
jgi:hypothetical protein